MNLIVYVPPKKQVVIEWLKKQADMRGWSLSKYVMYLLTKSMEEPNEKPT
jgi:hypothetical protein